MADLTPDDKSRLVAIHAAVDDPETFAGLIFDYYHDLDRAERTSRGQMYLHLGILAGVVMRVLQPSRPSITCPVCRLVSYNPTDIAEKYCGACHRFHDDVERGTSPNSQNTSQKGTSQT